VQNLERPLIEIRDRPLQTPQRRSKSVSTISQANAVLGTGFLFHVVEDLERPHWTAIEELELRE
jgi:hypothetical protein